MQNRTTVTVIEIKNATKNEETAFIKASELLEEKLNSEDFWYEVFIHYNSWRHNNGMDFIKFKESILGGRDKFETKRDFDIRISTTFYYSFKKVVGYTYPTTWLTWINRNVFKGFDLGDIAGNQMHEALHNIGFGHPGTDRGSVTYMMGYLVRDSIKRDLGKDPVRRVYKRTFGNRISSFFRGIFRYKRLL
jgi:hypothetical protein